MKNSIKKLTKYYKKDKEKIRSYGPFILIFLVSFIFFYPYFIQKKIPLPVDALVGAHVPWTEVKWENYPAGIPIKNQEITDAFSQFFPWRSLVGDFWRNGEAPLWNFYMFSGTPFLATLHSAALYPFNSLYLLFTDVDAWSLLVFLQILLSGSFMLLLLKELNLGRIAGILGAVIFMFSGYMIAWLEFATGGQAGLWLPLLLYLQLRFEKTGKYIFLTFIPFVFFFIYTAGDFQVPLYVTLTYVFFSLYLGFKNKKFWKLQLVFLSPLVLGVLLSAIQLIPTIELYFRSVRVDDPYIKEYFYGLMHWEKIVNFIWPDFFGNVVTGNYWGKFGYHEYMSFSGAVGLLLVFFSLIKKQKDKYEKFFWILLLFSLLFLFPTPLGFLPFKLHIPGLGTSSASRIIFLTDFTLAILAAYGFSKLNLKNLNSLLKTNIFLLIISFLVILVLVFKIFIFMGLTLVEITNLKVSLKNMVPSTAVLIASLISILSFNKLVKNKKLGISLIGFILLTLSLSEMLRFAWKNTPFSPREFVFPDTQITTFLKDNIKNHRIAGGIPLNLFMPYKITSAEGYDPIYPKINSEWFSLVNSATTDKALSGRYGLIHNFDSVLLDHASVKYIVDYRKNIYGGISEKGDYYPGNKEAKYEEVFREGRISVFENKNALPYVWMSNDVAKESEFYPSDIMALEPNDRKIILNEAKVVIEEIDQPVDYSIGEITKGFNRISIDVENSEDGYLFLAESYDPGWKAFVDDKETKVYRSNHIFQTVFLEKGKHSLEFIYSPKSFKIGKLLSISTLFVTFLSMIYLIVKKEFNKIK